MDNMSINLDSDANMLYCMEPLRKPLVKAIITSLQLPRGSRGLDVGCGLGLQTQLLAQAVGSDGQVTGIDYNASFLQVASMFAQADGLADCLSFRQGSWNQIPYQEATFDWVWSMDAVGYAPYEPVSTIKELARVVKPGGRLVIAYWSAQNLLPGYPVLEAHLNACPAGIAPFNYQATPENHYLRTTGWMRQLGLCDVRAETFVQTISAPLDMDRRNALAELFSMRWGTAQSDVSPEDWQAYLRLCKAASVDFIGDNPDYYAFFTYSVFAGTVSER